MTIPNIPFNFVTAATVTAVTKKGDLMELASNKPFNLVIDEFQEFYNISEPVYDDMQNIWDTYWKKSRMNLIVSGSIYSLMQKNPTLKEIVIWKGG